MWMVALKYFMTASVCLGVRSLEALLHWTRESKLMAKQFCRWSNGLTCQLKKRSYVPIFSGFVVLFLTLQTAIITYTANAQATGATC